MNKSLLLLAAIQVATLFPTLSAQTGKIDKSGNPGKVRIDENPGNEFKVEAERFADVQMLRYQVPGFEKLSIQQK